MSTTAKCKDCAHATWVRTPTGRIKQGVVGRCTAMLPPPPVMLCSQPIEHDPNLYRRRPGIWPDYKGRCDLFQPLTIQPTTKGAKP